MITTRPYVTLQLRPQAQADLAGLERENQKAALKAMRIITSLDLVGLGRHGGLKWKNWKGYSTRPLANSSGASGSELEPVPSACWSRIP